MWILSAATYVVMNLQYISDIVQTLVPKCLFNMSTLIYHDNLKNQCVEIYSHPQSMLSNSLGELVPLPSGHLSQKLPRHCHCFLTLLFYPYRLLTAIHSLLSLTSVLRSCFL